MPTIFWALIVFVLLVFFAVEFVELKSTSKRYNELLDAVVKLNKGDINYIKVEEDKYGDRNFTEIKFDDREFAADDDSN